MGLARQKATECCALCLMPQVVSKEGIPMQKVQPGQPPLSRSGQGSKPPAHLRKNVHSTVHYANMQAKPSTHASVCHDSDACVVAPPCCARVHRNRQRLPFPHSRAFPTQSGPSQPLACVQPTGTTRAHVLFQMQPSKMPAFTITTTAWEFSSGFALLRSSCRPKPTRQRNATRIAAAACNPFYLVKSLLPTANKHKHNK